MNIKLKILTLILASGPFFLISTVDAGGLPGTFEKSQAEDALSAEAGEAPTPAERIIDAANPALAPFLDEMLRRNPEIASLRAMALSKARRAPQAKALPDPVLSLTAYLLSPETRVGPQQASVAYSQRFPWKGTLKAKEKAAIETAAAAAARVEARKIELTTEARRLVLEMSFLDAREREIRLDISTLSHYEELARARYASGVGHQQEVVKIQAEITRDQSRLLEIETIRAGLRARLNAMRDLPADTPIPRFEIPPLSPDIPELEMLRREALTYRPEIAAARSEIASARQKIELAEKARKPDMTAGLRYTLVGQRNDSAGRTSPPKDSGRDILGIFGAVNLPIRREKLDAGVEEAVQLRLSAEENLRSITASIEGRLGDERQRLLFSSRQVELFTGVLMLQAKLSLESAENGYASGTLNALDLLDAERILLEIRIAEERFRTDHAIARARIEGVIAAPLDEISELETTE